MKEVQPFQIIKQLIIEKGRQALALYYCSKCYDAVYIEAYLHRKVPQRIYFFAVCENCGAREPLAMFNLRVMQNRRIAEAWIQPYRRVGVVKWRR